MSASTKPEPLLSPCLDYGRSFICTLGPLNYPRFWVESRCRIACEGNGRVREYYQCGSCKGEDTFAASDLFLDPNYDFLPVFTEDELIVFRRHAWCGEGCREHATGEGAWAEEGAADPRFQYRQVQAMEGHRAWGGMVPRLREVAARPLATAEEMTGAATAGLPLIGQTEIRDETTGTRAVLEYPVKTLNLRAEDGLWQVDTGPVVLPDLAAPPEQWSATLRLAFVAFNTFDWADFVVEQPTPILAGGQEVARVYHYSGIMHLEARSVLLAQEPD